MTRWLVVSAFVALATVLSAQEVRMTNGEVLAGSVVSVDGSRAKVRTTDGAMRMVDARSIDVELRADGTEKRHPCTLVAGPIAPPIAALLARLQKGEPLEMPDLSQLTMACSADLVAELGKVADGKAAAPRALAVRALTMSATKEGLRAALDRAIADRTGALWREVAAQIPAGACLGALEALGAVEDVDKGLTSKEKGVRFGCASAASKLGSKAALPVLATFVGDSDHHVRESAAVTLAECGDPAGAKILMVMCKRERAPVEDANRDADAATRDLVARIARRERIRACELLGKLRFAAAASTLQALGKHADAAIAAAAQRAAAAIEAGADKDGGDKDGKPAGG